MFDFLITAHSAVATTFPKIFRAESPPQAS